METTPAISAGWQECASGGTGSFFASIYPGVTRGVCARATSVDCVCRVDRLLGEHAEDYRENEIEVNFVFCNAAPIELKTPIFPEVS